MRITRGTRLKWAINCAIVADVDNEKKGCPLCGGKPEPGSPPFVAHKDGCKLLSILVRVDAVFGNYAGKMVKL